MIRYAINPIHSITKYIHVKQNSNHKKNKFANYSPFLFFS